MRVCENLLLFFFCFFVLLFVVQQETTTKGWGIGGIKRPIRRALATNINASLGSENNENCSCMNM